MESVEPIRDKKKIESMKKYLKSKNVRDYVLFSLGINSGLRISDLLNLTVEDVKGKDRIAIREQKTGKTKNFPLSEKSKEIIASYIKQGALDSGYLFPSRKGSAPISRIQAYRIINDAARYAKVKDNVGTHTMRKTFGYWAYKAGYDIAMIQKLLNHSAPSVTLRYIGIQQDELDEVYLNLDL